MKTEWDYSERAVTYDQRADYAIEAVANIVTTAGMSAGTRVADIGAGTGKLTKLLLTHGLVVDAVEPNDQMRGFGVRNTKGEQVTWSKAVGEQTGLGTDRYMLTTFGSSFNVTDRQATLREAARILKPGGWFCCLWNHRDLSDPIQAAVEQAIKARVPNYDYGTRREDQTAEIARSGLFEPAVKSAFTLRWTTPVSDYINAWRSHATLARQAPEGMEPVISAIQQALPEGSELEVPYTTRVWMAKLK